MLLPFIWLSCIGIWNAFAYYPTDVEIFPMRVDVNSKLPVERGRFELVGGYPLKPSNNSSKRLSITDLKMKLQCAPVEEDMYAKLQFLKLIPYTKKSLTIMSAFLETNCEPWWRCHDNMKEFMNGKYRNGLSNHISSPGQGRIIRIHQNKLYIDFPWGLERFGTKQNPMIPYNTRSLFNALLSIVQVKDSVFLMNEEYTYLPMELPLPSFSCSPSDVSGIIEFTW